MANPTKPSIVRTIVLLVPSVILGVAAAFGISSWMDERNREYRREQIRLRNLSLEDDEVTTDVAVASSTAATNK